MPLKRRGSLARRHPNRRASVPASAEMRHRPFEDLVAMALDDLPGGVHKLLENVAVVIEDEPSAEQLHDAGLDPDQTLYGLYEGVSPVTYGASWAPWPNKITIFRLALEEDFPDPYELSREVQRTVIHELGHHAGFDDLRLIGFGFG
ncbi:MAG: metallopeptidase family protein [Candidatus Limnocylindrales bacterium]